MLLWVIFALYIFLAKDMYGNVRWYFRSICSLGLYT